MTDDMFIREDISKPENRINLALFSLMQQDRIREWLLTKLGLSTDAVVYPSKGRHSFRPDLKVVRASSTLAWIEVELGKDEDQVERYRGTFPEPVKTICGKKNDGGDLSLEEVDDYLDEQMSLTPQVVANVKHLRELIKDGLGQHSSSPGRGDVSEEMWEHPLVAGLRKFLGDRLEQHRTGSVPNGYLRADTTDTSNNQGFSLRVRSTVSSGGTLSVMNITAGRSEVAFPSRARLRKYLPDHHSEIDTYSSVLAELGLDIGSYGEFQRPSLPLDRVLSRLDDLARCVHALAGAPAGRPPA